MHGWERFHRSIKKYINLDIVLIDGDEIDKLFIKCFHSNILIKFKIKVLNLPNKTYTLKSYPIK